MKLGDKMTRFIILLFLLFIGVPSYAAIFSVGVNEIFGKTSTTLMQDGLNDVNLADDLNVSRNIALPELFASINSQDFSFRAFYLQSRGIDGAGFLNKSQYKKEDKGGRAKPLPVNSTFNFSASRLEAGYPFIGYSTILEPFAVASSVKKNLAIQGEKLNLNFSTETSAIGAGCLLIQRIRNGSNFTIKGYLTGIDGLLDLEYCGFVQNVFWKCGYSWRTYRQGHINLNLSGPVISLGMVF